MRNTSARLACSASYLLSLLLLGCKADHTLSTNDLVSASLPRGASLLAFPVVKNYSEVAVAYRAASSPVDRKALAGIMTLRDLEAVAAKLEPSQSHVEVRYGFSYSRDDPRQAVGRVVYALLRSDRLSQPAIGGSPVMTWDPDLRVITTYRGHIGLASPAIAPAPLLNRILYVPPLSIRTAQDLAVLVRTPAAPVFLMTDRSNTTFMECWQYAGQSLDPNANIKYVIWIEKTSGVVLTGISEGPDSDGIDMRVIWVLDYMG